MKFFANWPEDYAIPNQEASTAAVAMLTKFFCRFDVSLELHSDQSRNFESKLMQVVMERLGSAKLDQHSYTRRQMVWRNPMEDD
jgi:hypothetical protein